jgi:hypothetical protein
MHSRHPSGCIVRVDLRGLDEGRMGSVDRGKEEQHSNFVTKTEILNNF